MIRRTVALAGGLGGLAALVLVGLSIGSSGSERPMTGATSGEVAEQGSHRLDGILVGQATSPQVRGIFGDVLLPSGLPQGNDEKGMNDDKRTFRSDQRTSTAEALSADRESTDDEERGSHDADQLARRDEPSGNAGDGENGSSSAEPSASSGDSAPDEEDSSGPERDSDPIPAGDSGEGGGDVRLGSTSVATRVADCESGARLADGSAVEGSFNLTAENPTSSASGKYQFIDSTWVWVWEDIIGEDLPAARAKDATEAQQDRAFWALWDDGSGASHWEPSVSCHGLR